MKFFSIPTRKGGRKGIGVERKRGKQKYMMKKGRNKKKGTSGEPLLEQ